MNQQEGFIFKKFWVRESVIDWGRGALFPLINFGSKIFSFHKIKLKMAKRQIKKGLYFNLRKVMFMTFFLLMLELWLSYQNNSSSFYQFLLNTIYIWSYLKREKWRKDPSKKVKYLSIIFKDLIFKIVQKLITRRWKRISRRFPNNYLVNLPCEYRCFNCSFQTKNPAQRYHHIRKVFI